MRNKTGGLALMAIATLAMAVLAFRSCDGVDHRSGRESPSHEQEEVDLNSPLLAPSPRKRGAETPAANTEERSIAIRIKTVGVDGEVISGAHVTASIVASFADWILPRDEDQGEPVRAIRGQTDSDGTVRLELPAAWLKRKVRVGGYDDEGVRASPRSLPMSDSAKLVMLTLLPSSSVRGVVLGLDAAELKSAWVDAYCTSWSETPNHRRIAIGADAEFVVPGVVRRVSLSLRCPGRAPSAISKLRLEDGEVKRVELMAGERGASGRIILATQDGEPLVRGSLALIGAKRSQWSRVRVAEGGALEISGQIPKGADLNIHVWPTRDGSSDVWQTTELRQKVPSSVWMHGGRVTVPSAARTVFRIRGVDGTPLAELPARLLQVGGESPRGRPLELTTDAHGILDLGNAPYPSPVGACRLVMCDRHELWTGSLTSSADEIVIERPDLRVFKVNLVDRDGRPSTSSSVHALLSTDAENDAPRSWRIGFQTEHSARVCLTQDEYNNGQLLLNEPGLDGVPLGTPRSFGTVATIKPSPKTGSCTLSLVDKAGNTLSIPHIVRLRPQPTDKTLPRSLLVSEAAVDGTVNIVSLPPGRYIWTAHSGTKKFDGTMPIDVLPGSVIHKTLVIP